MLNTYCVPGTLKDTRNPVMWKKDKDGRKHDHLGSAVYYEESSQVRSLCLEEAKLLKQTGDQGGLSEVVVS